MEFDMEDLPIVGEIVMCIAMYLLQKTASETEINDLFDAVDERLSVQDIDDKRSVSKNLRKGILEGKKEAERIMVLQKMNRRHP